MNRRTHVRIVAGALALMLFLSHALSAQEAPVNYTGWYGYEGYHPLREGDPWGLFGEGYIKRNDDFIGEPMQYFVRLGLNYDLPSGDRLTGGIAYQHNRPYDYESEPYNWPDYRLWEQYMIRRRVANGMWVHRFRMEQRWLGRKDDPSMSGYSEYEFENTFRYMLRRTMTINERLYGIVYGELHARLPPDDSQNVLDQNRIYLGLGVNLGKKNNWWRIETGYMFQQSFRDSGDELRDKRINHVFRVSLVSDAPFR